MGSIGITFLVVTAVIYLGEVRSQLVPEDVVYTNPRAAFWEGQQIVSLPCLFRGEPIAVYWKKGATVDTAEDLIVWYNGQKSGTRFDDGSVDILVSQNYSLVFKQPLDFDMAGNYICRVSNYKAELHANSTTVTVREFQMQTTPKLTVWKGETASLPCKLPYTPYRVQWVDESSGKVVANYTDGTFHPPSGGNGRYSIEEDFSLTISEVSVLDEATLTCEVFAHDSKSWRNSTELTVNAHGSHPSFDRCQGDKQCTKEVNNRDFQLSCTVHGAKPNVTISLTAAGKSDLTLLPASFERREDGSSDQTVYANVSMSFESSSETFTCSTHGEAAHGTESVTITVILKSGGLSVGAVFGIIAIILIVLGLVFFLVFKRMRKKQDDGHKGDNCCTSFLTHRSYERSPDCEGNRTELAASSEPLKNLRTQIQSYKPGDATESKLNVEKVNLGLFGVMSTGKSAFINSVMFALTGEYHKHADDTTDDLMAGGSVTQEKIPYHLTSHITLFDNRGLQSYLNDTTQYMDQMRDNTGVGKRIHCPICVADARDENATNDLKRFLDKFRAELKDSCDVELKYVFTHKRGMEKKGRDPQKLFKNIQKNMIVVENYSDSDHGEDVERSTELLEFIWSCLKTAERNIESMEKRETDKSRARAFFGL